MINTALDEFFPPDGGVKIIAEPGRYFVESVFTLAAAVFAKKVIDDVDEDYGNETAILKSCYCYYKLLDNCFDKEHEKLKPFFFSFPFVPLDYKKDISGRKMMYYLKDGVYGSLSCILNDAAELKPYLHRVNII